MAIKTKRTIAVKSINGTSISNIHSPYFVIKFYLIFKSKSDFTIKY